MSLQNLLIVTGILLLASTAGAIEKIPPDPDLETLIAVGILGTLGVATLIAGVIKSED